jgi:hypothetical protein
MTIAIPERYTLMAGTKYDATLEAMRAVPAATHAEYPQYNDYWADWILVVVRRNVECKGGRALEFWQVSIGQRQPADQFGGPTWTVYSPQRDSNIGRIPLEDVVEVVRV